MLTNPLLSVALPVKNGLPHLRDTIEGLRRQTCHCFELCVQDGGSTDGSLEYLHNLDVSFAVHVVSEHDGSLTAGYNRALGRCIGDIVVAAACDEVLDDSALELYASWYHQHPDAVFIYGGSRIISRSGAVQEYQPKEFGLIDYVRHQNQMCPTTAGAFNRRLLGTELRLDESLKTVPDFELITRLALRFGEDRIVCKKAITMSARGDEVSMSFRPEAFAQFARDKRTVLDRLLSGQLREAFFGYLRRDILFNMHAQFAEQTYSLAGDEPVFREHVIAAAAEMPGVSRLKSVAALSRHFRWDEPTRSPILRQNVAPLPPPREARLLSRINPHSIHSEPHWIVAGVSLDYDSAGTRLRTAADPWHYSALVALQFCRFERANSWCWLRIIFSDVHGTPMAALFDPASNALNSEVLLPSGQGTSEHFFELHDPTYTHLLFRNGTSNETSSVSIHGIELLTMPVAPELAA